uniref:Uncharacterized protein n=1 Tax=Ditylenchus dipsaci TaxID=166011 RepID=A0A915E697_9BILA
DKVDCLKEGNANAAGTVEQARVAKEKVTQAKGVLESAVTTEAKTAALNSYA